MLRACLLPDDEPCAPVANTPRLGCLQLADEKARPVLRTSGESTSVPQRNTLGGPVSILHGEFGYLRACLLPLYRAQSGPRGNGSVSRALPLVESIRERARPRR